MGRYLQQILHRKHPESSDLKSGFNAEPLSSQLPGRVEDSKKEQSLVIPFATGNIREASLEKNELPKLAGQTNDSSPQADIFASQTKSTEIREQIPSTAIRDETRHVAGDSQQQRPSSVSIAEGTRPSSQNSLDATGKQSYEGSHVALEPPLNISRKMSKEDVHISPNVASGKAFSADTLQKMALDNVPDSRSITSSHALLNEDSKSTTDHIAGRQGVIKSST